MGTARAKTASTPPPTAAAHKSTKLPILDGWRATSILLVLAAHLVPLYPTQLQLNHVAGAMGMALFFTLSGFLIVRFLAGGMQVDTFLVRRGARILPLAWVIMAGLAIWNQAGIEQIAANFLFYANYPPPPTQLFYGGGHLWSICVEMQFYAAAALLALLPNRKGLYLVPVLCIAVTLVRVWQGAYISIYTWQRIDEILAGGTVALIYLGWLGDRARRALARIPFWPALAFLVLTSHPETGFLQYLRPYAASALVAGTLFRAPPKLINRLLTGRLFAYIAEISYALYMVHGVLMATWLYTGDTVEKLIKRPLLIVLTFVIAHVSTRYFERPLLNAARSYGKGNQMPVLGEAASR